jgi:hypothetical protein
VVKYKLEVTDATFSNYEKFVDSLISLDQSIPINLTDALS